jgi:hypothetical protein
LSCLRTGNTGRQGIAFLFIGIRRSDTGLTLRGCDEHGLNLYGLLREKSIGAGTPPLQLMSHGSAWK